jgi:serine/threonine protein kinase
MATIKSKRKLVAVKESRAEEGDPDGIIQAAYNEISAMEALSNAIPSCIPNVYAYAMTVEDGEQVFRSVTKLGAGGSLQNSIEEYAQYESGEDKKRNIVQLWTAIKKMEELGWAHRDIWPGNIVFTNSRNEYSDPWGSMMFIDFGYATQQPAASTVVGSWGVYLSWGKSVTLGRQVNCTEIGTWQRPWLDIG